MPALINCTICANNYSCTDFRVFFCGHGYCKDCVAQLFKTTPTKCPACRKGIQKKDIQPIYLDLVVVHPKETFTDTVCEGFGKMDAKTPLESVKRAAERADKGAKLTKGDKDLTTRLLESIEDFKKRILPMFELVHTQRQEIDTLTTSLETSSNTLSALQREHTTKCKPLSTKVASLESQLAHATNLADRAKAIAEDMSGEIQVLKRDRDGYQKAFEEEEKRRKDIAGRDALNAGVLKRTREKYEKVKDQLRELQEKHDSLVRVHEQSQTLAASSPRRTSQRLHYDDDENGYDEDTDYQTRTPRRTLKIQNHSSSAFDFEGLPARPNQFGSNWNIQSNSSRSYGALTKVKLKPQPSSDHRRVANPAIRLDAKGKPTAAVQLGPKRTLKI